MDEPAADLAVALALLGNVIFFEHRRAEVAEWEGKTLRVGSFGGAGVNTLARGTFDFEGAREAYLASLARLREEAVDVFIGNHTWNNDTYTRSVAFCAGVGANPFINPKLFRTFLGACEQRLLAVVKREEAEERAAR